MNRKLAVLAVAAGLTVAGLGSANAAPSAKSNPVTCFTDDSGSTCVQKGSSFTLTNDAGEWSGVYVEKQSISGQPFSAISALGFSYTGIIPGGGPRFSLPILGADNRDGWVFVDAAACNDGAGHVAPLLDPTCTIDGYYWTAEGTPESFHYESWAAFLAGESSSVVGNNYAYIVADQAGSTVLSDVKLSRSAPGKSK